MPQLHVERGLRWREEWREEGWREGFEEGWREGVVLGLRECLVDMAEERFGEHAAQRLAVALEGRSSPETFTTVGKLMFACDTEEEFIERLPTESPCPNPSAQLDTSPNACHSPVGKSRKHPRFLGGG